MRVESDGLSTVLYSYGGLSERTEVTVWGDCSRTRYWNVNDKATVVALPFRQSGRRTFSERSIATQPAKAKNSITNYACTAIRRPCSPTRAASRSIGRILRTAKEANSSK